MEVAGLILGAFPLILLATKHGRKAGTLHRRVREEYNNCRLDIEFHQILYKSNLRNLLGSIIDETTDIDMLLSDPDGEAWRDDGLQKRLEDRLEDSYTVYINIMRRMNEAILKLAEELRIDDVTIQKRLLGAETLLQGPASHSSPNTTFAGVSTARSWWDFEIFRTKFSFNDARRKDLFSALHDCNTRLEKLLQIRDQLPRTGAAAAAATEDTSSVLSTLQNRHQNSITLYRAIHSCWNCPCREHHYANLRLEHRTTSRDPAFQLIFTSAPSPALGNPGWVLQALKFERKADVCSCSETLGSQSPASTPPWSPVLASHTKVKPKSPLPKSVDPLPPGSAATDVQLCQRLANLEDDDQCLGTISYNGEVYHINKFSRYKDGEFTLGDALARASRPSRRLRYYVALLLASSVAQLQTTPWLSRGIAQTSVLFYPFLDGFGSEEDVYREPFIRQGFTSGDVSVTGSEGLGEWAFHVLGITLLELCFGKRLEDHPLYAASFSSQRERECFEIVLAKMWAKSVRDEAGHAYAEAVEWCLEGGGECHLSSGSWRNDMIKHVIIPLAKCHEYLEIGSK